MRKWEEDYQYYSSSILMEEKFAILEDKVNGKVAFKEEYAEYKKLSAIKANLPKVKNILELRKFLENENQEIKDEIEHRLMLTKIAKANEMLEEQMAKLEKDYAKLQTELKDKSLSDEDRAKKQQLLKGIEAKKQENNNNFAICQEKFKQEAARNEKNIYKDIAVEELKEKSYQISMKVSKCNLACNKLMQGYSWNSIDLALEKFKDKRLVVTGEQAKKMEAMKSAAKSNGQKESVKENDEEKALTVSDEKTSVFSRVKGFLQKGWNWVKEKFASKEDKTEQEKTETEKKEEPKVETKTEKEEDFRQYLKAVAEKGVYAVAEEKRNQMETSKEEEINKAAQRIFEARKEAVERAGGKFDEASAMKKAKEIAERAYNKKHKEDKGDAR